MHLALWAQGDPKGRLRQEVIDAVESWGIRSPRIAQELLKQSYQKEATKTSSYWDRRGQDTNTMRDKRVKLPTRTLKAPAQELQSEIKVKPMEVSDDKAFEEPLTPKPPRVLKRRASSAPPMACNGFEETKYTNSATDDSMDPRDDAKFDSWDGAQHEASSMAAGYEVSSRAGDASTSSSIHNYSDMHRGIGLRPLNNSNRLRRRTGTLPSNQRKKQQHRGSIFDLVEDDVNTKTRQEKIATSIDRPKPPVTNNFSPRNLYLPR